MEHLMLIKHMDDRIERDGWYPRAESEYHPLPLYTLAAIAVLSREHGVTVIEWSVGDFTEDEIMKLVGIE